MIRQSFSMVLALTAFASSAAMPKDMLAKRAQQRTPFSASAQSSSAAAALRASLAARTQATNKPTPGGHKPSGHAGRGAANLPKPVIPAQKPNKPQFNKIAKAEEKKA